MTKLSEEYFEKKLKYHPRSIVQHEYTISQAEEFMKTYGLIREIEGKIDTLQVYAEEFRKDPETLDSWKDAETGISDLRDQLITIRKEAGL